MLTVGIDLQHVRNTTSINDFNKNKFVVRFSNLVNFTGIDLDTHILDNYVRSASIPDLSIPMLTSMYMHERQLHPNPIGARDLQSITIEFKLDEEMKNFYYFYCWIDAMRHGETCGKKSLKGEELLRMDCIDAIEIVSLNNDNKIQSKMKFKHAILTNLQNVNLEYGTSEICTFTCTFDYETVELQLQNLEDK